MAVREVPPCQMTWPDRTGAWIEYYDGERDVMVREPLDRPHVNVKFTVTINTNAFDLLAADIDNTIKTSLAAEKPL